MVGALNVQRRGKGSSSNFYLVSGKKCGFVKKYENSVCLIGFLKVI